MAKELVMTNESFQALVRELEMLKVEKRQEIAEKIRVARGFGDLSENSEYDEAKNEQAIIEARILEIENMLKDVKIIDEHELSTEVVYVGSKVKVKDREYNEILDYKIVGPSEANPREGKISDESPVGAALLGHKVGQIVKIETPGGICTYEILDIYK